MQAPDDLEKLKSELANLRLQNEAVLRSNKADLRLELFRQINNNASKDSTELTTTFYVYLVAVSIAIPGIYNLALSYLQFRDLQKYLSSFMLEVLTALALISLALLSLFFLWRFRDLSKRWIASITLISEFKRDLSNKDIDIKPTQTSKPILLKPDEEWLEKWLEKWRQDEQQPGRQQKTEQQIAEELNERLKIEKRLHYQGIPAYIRRITILIFCAAIGGAVFVIGGLLIYHGFAFSPKQPIDFANPAYYIGAGLAAVVAAVVAFIPWIKQWKL